MKHIGKGKKQFVVTTQCTYEWLVSACCEEGAMEEATRRTNIHAPLEFKEETVKCITGFYSNCIIATVIGEQKPGSCVDKLAQEPME